MRKIYSTSLIVSKKDIDQLGHVNNLVYLEWVLKISGMHWNLLSTNEINAKYVWVVLRHEIDYLSSVKLNDEILISTWIGDSFGVKSERFVEIKFNQKIVARAKTTWCLLDRNSMKATRIPSNIIQLLK